MKKTDKEIIEKLQAKVEIPEIVMEKAEQSLRKIQGSAAQADYIHSFNRRMGKAAVVFAAALTLTAATVSAAVVYHWNQQAAEQMQADEKQQQTLAEKGMAAEVEASCETKGVELRAVQTIADYRYVYIWFELTNKNQELELPDGEITFRNEEISIEGMDTGWGYSGAPFEKSEDGIYRGRIDLAHEEQETLDGAKVTAEFTDLAVYNTELDKETVLEGRWTLEWTLRTSEEVKDLTVDKAIPGYDGCEVKRVILTPISFTVYEKTMGYSDAEPGMMVNGKMMNELPQFAGFLMRDGSIDRRFGNGLGMSGAAEEDGLYVTSESFARVMEPDEVEALLFFKKGYQPQEGEEVLMENLEKVEIGS